MVYLLTLASECILLSLPPQPRDNVLFKRMYVLAVLQSYGTSAYTLVVIFKPSSFPAQTCKYGVDIAVFSCIPLSGAGLRTARAFAVIFPAIKTIILANDLHSFKQRKVLSSISTPCLQHELDVQ